MPSGTCVFLKCQFFVQHVFVHYNRDKFKFGFYKNCTSLFAVEICRKKNIQQHFPDHWKHYKKNMCTFAKSLFTDLKANAFLQCLKKIILYDKEKWLLLKKALVGH